MPKKVSDEIILAAVNAANNAKDLTNAARLLGIARSTLVWRLKIAEDRGLTSGTNPATKGGKKWEVDDNAKNNTKMVWSIDDRVRTVDDALAKADVDLDIWEVERSVVNSWEVGVKGAIKISGAPVINVQPLWQVKVWLRRKIPKIYTDASDALVNRMQKYAPKYQPSVKSKAYTEPHMLEISVFDLHFGKLAWGRETGTDYDISIAETLFKHAVEDLVAKVKHFQLDRVLFPVGQDFFHIDNPTKTTVNGTPQDVDARYAKLFETGTMACINAIDFLRRLAPVKVLYVPGNHDRTAAWHLASFMGAWYKDDKEVSVDTAPTTRKYEHYGINLLGFTHGDEEPHRDLPTIMASEEPQKWAESKCREWHLGHFHKKKEIRHTTGDSFGPVHVRVLPSLSGTDAWHYRKGYTEGRRAAEAYLWSKSDGYVGHFNVYART